MLTVSATAYLNVLSASPECARVESRTELEIEKKWQEGRRNEIRNKQKI